MRNSIEPGLYKTGRAEIDGKLLAVVRDLQKLVFEKSTVEDFDAGTIAQTHY
jgi:hypothetical protein